MINEIIEALENYYDDDDNLADALYYLYHKSNDYMLRLKTHKKMYSMNKCVHCNCDLELRKYNEIHNELEGNPIEHIAEIYCPNCGSRYK